jgi:uncharacterized protein with NAD-binding domain and iron-sulfur cluster
MNLVWFWIVPVSRGSVTDGNSGIQVRSKISGTQTRVAIVGGGPGGIATAFWLTSTQALRDRFHVTLWTRGWRLGGKGATGRNAAQHNRIEEHGLHLWLGFYQDSFRTMREAFAELGPDAKGIFTSVEQAFLPVYQAAFMQRDGPGDPPSYLPWIINFPQRPGCPGNVPPSPQVVRAILEWLHNHLQQRLVPSVGNDASDAILRKLEDIMQARDDPPLDAANTVLAVVQELLDIAQVAATGLPSDLGRTVRRDLLLANLAVSFGRGYIADIASHENEDAAYDELNVLEFREWLRRHRAWESSLACAPLQGIYDLAFAYPNGDATDPLNGAIAAGIAVQLLVHMLLLYQDAPLWKMSAGMGETVFTPLYDVLQTRGVVVNFFHALEDVVPTADGANIGALQLRRQAVVANPPYQPFVTVKDLRCWSSEPDWTQLVKGEALKTAGVRFEATEDTTGTSFSLVLDRDFDAVVLAVPPDVLKLVTPKLSERNANWAAMLDNASCIATQAFQLWLSSPSAELGFPAQPPPPLTAYREPYATWSDMSHLLPREAWPDAGAPRSISYHCGPMVSGAPVPPPVGDGQAEIQAETWLTVSAAGLWPGLSQTHGELNDLIVSAYFRANTDPSERYALVLPGSIKFRMAPGGSPFANLYLAGDWTRTLVSGGCFENAVQSGMMAAEAISDVRLRVGDT